MIYEMTKFEKQVLAHLSNERRDQSLTLGAFLKMHRYSNYFRGSYSFISILQLTYICYVMFANLIPMMVDGYR
jgi:hypothetical protein